MSSRVPIKRGFNKDRFEIEMLSRNYLNSKRIIKMSQNCVKNYSRVRLETHMKVICHIEYAIQLLPEEEQFIIRNEVLYGKGGKWYLGYYTHSGYYNIRKKAYRNFLRCL